MKKATLLILSAVFAAIAASACCILPLILGVVGAGTLGLGAALAPYRPYLMGLTLLLLGAGFYFAYRPAKTAGEAECCVTSEAGGCTHEKALRTKQLSRAMLWAITVFTLAVVAYPQIAEYRAGTSAASAPVVITPTKAQMALFTIPSMDCPSCAVHIADVLKKTPGVYDAKVDFDTKQATVHYDATRINLPRLREVIDRTGFPTKEIVPSVGE
jgi:copper chaperone CopZ